MALNPQRSSLLTKKRTDPFAPPGDPSGFGSVAQLAALGEGVKLIDEGLQGISGFKGQLAGAEQLEFNARQETLIGEQQALQTLESLNEAQASNIVAAFASGVRLQGSITRAQTALGRKAGFTTTIAKTNAAIRSGALEREARRVRAEAEYQRSVAPLKIVAGVGLTAFGLS